MLVLDKQQMLPENPEQVAGTFFKERERNRIRFVPEESFKTGTTYRAVFEADHKLLERDFYVRRLNAFSSVKVEQVYPSQASIPQNIQRFYIHFSDSMSRGFALKNIHFVNEYGDTVRNALINQKERWSNDMKRLRLDLHQIPYEKGQGWFDTLNTRFERLQKYRLVVESGMRDAQGRSLTNDFYKQYTIWWPAWGNAGGFQITSSPPKGTLDPVVMKSNKAHDIVSMRERLELTDTEGNPIPGRAEITNNEKTWTFYPEKPWVTQQYQVRISDYLEDLVGNTRTTSVAGWRENRLMIAPTDSAGHYYHKSFWPR